MYYASFTVITVHVTRNKDTEKRATRVIKLIVFIKWYNFIQCHAQPLSQMRSSVILFHWSSLC